MEITISITCDNSAFDNDPEMEVSSILKKTAKHFEQSGIEDRNLYDSNGNLVGCVEVAM